MKLINKYNKENFLKQREKSRLQELQSISDSLFGFFERNHFETKEDVAKILDNVKLITSCCNNISYNEELAAETYILWHFLDRYHRFQLIYDYLVEKGLLSFNTGKKYPYDFLDIGTGPGMSMYALVNFLEQIKKINTDSPLDYKIDYLERSVAFRYFLHMFTENLGAAQGGYYFNVPFHRGNFRDCTDIEFNEFFKYLDYDDEGGSIVRQTRIKHRFDFVISSNFFTDFNFFERNIESFQKVLDNMRNGAILVIVGGSSGKYEQINERIKEYCLAYSDKSGKFKASLSQIELDSTKMHYNLNSPAGVIINNFRQRFFDIVENTGLVDSLDENLITHRDNCLKKGKSHKIGWNIMVFKKHSQFKHKKK